MAIIKNPGGAIGGGGSNLYVHRVYGYTANEKCQIIITIINNNSEPINTNNKLHDAITNSNPVKFTSRPIEATLIYVDDNNIAHTSLQLTLFYNPSFPDERKFSIVSWETGSYVSLKFGFTFPTVNDYVYQI